MLWRGRWSIMFVILALMSGCRSSSTPPITVKADCVIEVKGLVPKQVETVRQAVDAIPGVESGSVPVNPEDQSVAFKVTDKKGRDVDGVFNDVVAKLEELGLKTGSHKLRIQAEPDWEPKR